MLNVHFTAIIGGSKVSSKLGVIKNPFGQSLTI